MLQKNRHSPLFWRDQSIIMSRVTTKLVRKVRLTHMPVTPKSKLSSEPFSISINWTMGILFTIMINEYVTSNNVTLTLIRIFPH